MTNLQYIIDNIGVTYISLYPQIPMAGEILFSSYVIIEKNYNLVNYCFYITGNPFNNVFICLFQINANIPEQVGLICNSLALHKILNAPVINFYFYLKKLAPHGFQLTI